MDDRRNVTFGVLTLIGVVGVICSLPLALDLQEAIIREAGISLFTVIVAGVAQSIVLVAFVTAVGLWLGPEAGFATPRLRLDRPALVIGLGVGAAILVVDRLAFVPHLPAGINDFADITIWKRYIASFYGGFTEELLLRFGLLTLVVWIVMRLRKRKGGPSDALFWMTNIVVAVAFGLAHLPATQLLTELTTLVIVRAIVLNGAAGIAFGSLYRSRGLEAAFAAHFAADIALQTGVTLLY